MGELQILKAEYDQLKDDHATLLKKHKEQGEKIIIYEDLLGECIAYIDGEGHNKLCSRIQKEIDSHNARRSLEVLGQFLDYHAEQNKIRKNKKPSN